MRTMSSPRKLAAVLICVVIIAVPQYLRAGQSVAGREQLAESFPGAPNNLRAETAALTVTTTPNPSVKTVRFSGVLPSAINDAADAGASGATSEPLTGVQGVTFALYAEQSGGAPLWLETQNVTCSNEGDSNTNNGGGSGANDAQCHYTVLLGSMREDGLPQEIGRASCRERV